MFPEKGRVGLRDQSRSLPTLSLVASPFLFALLRHLPLPHPTLVCYLTLAFSFVLFIPFYSPDDHNPDAALSRRDSA